MNQILDALQDKDNNKACAFAKELEVKSAASNMYYSYFDDFVSLLPAKSSYVRIRGFILCCAQARWDDEGKIQNALPKMLLLLHDEKPIVVRQCLQALHEVVLFKPELSEQIKNEITSIDISKYKDSMSPLIQKDINDLLKMIN